MIFISKFSKPSLITYLGIIVGVAGIYFAATNIYAAMICLFACAICDFFDGKFARKFKRDDREKRFGIAIDSLADTLAFVALPVAILFNVAIVPAVAITVAIVYVAAGITRLAAFTAAADPGKPTKIYRGLPITCAGAIVPTVYFAVAFCVSARVVGIILAAVYAILAALFVLNIKVKKP